MKTNDNGPGLWLTGVVAFAAAVVVLLVEPHVSELAILWPANALILASVLLGTGKHALERIIAGAIGTFVANIVAGGPLAVSLGYAIANGTEVTVAIALIRSLKLHERPFGRLDTIAAFSVVAGGAAPAVGAFIGATTAYLLADQPFLTVYSVWYRSCALGALLVTPMAVILWRSRRPRRPRTRLQMLDGLISMGAVAAVTILSFSLPLPLLFLPLAAMVIATVRIGWTGAVRSTLVVAIIGTAYTLNGRGPISQLIDAGGHLTLLQFYIVSCFLTVLTVASLLEERKRLTRTVMAIEARYRLLSENSADALLHVDVDGTCLYASPACADLIGLTPAEIEGTSLARLIHPDDRAKVRKTHLDIIGTPGASGICRYRVRHSDGSERWHEVRTRGIHDASGIATGAVSAIRDVTGDMAREATLSIAAATDPLTGLANRRHFLDAMELQQRQGGDTGFAVAMLDLDHFKAVNDLHGHAGGDEVLKQVARVCQDMVRGNDLVGRLGGEEFALLLTGADERTATDIAERVRKAIERQEVVTQDGTSIRVTASIGVALAQPGLDAAALLARADAQLYVAKAEGRNRLRLAA